MDWELAIKRNRDALLRIVGMLCAAAGIVPGGSVPTLKRHVRNHVMRFLRSAEAATRRVIYIRALEIEVPEPEPPPDRASGPSEDRLRGDNATARPDGRLHGTHKNPLSRARCGVQRRGADTGPPQTKGGPASSAGQQRVPAFPLIDPRKRFFDRKPKRLKGPGPRVRSLFDDWAPSPPAPPPPPEPHPDDPVSAKRLCQRLQALHAALEDIPGQARRMARIMARRAKAPPGPGCVPPLRPGYPPGHRKRHIHPVDAVLDECQSLAQMRMRDVYAATLKPG